MPASRLFHTDRETANKITKFLIIVLIVSAIVGIFISKRTKKVSQEESLSKEILKTEIKK